VGRWPGPTRTVSWLLVPGRLRFHTAWMEIDPRGPRVNALITTVVLAVVLVTSPSGPLARTTRRYVIS